MADALRRLVYGGTSYLWSYEAACLLAWRARLAASARQVFGKQMESFDMVQRLSVDKLVTFHSFKYRKRDEWIAAAAAYKLLADEVRAARVSLRMKDKRIKALIVLHEGRLSSLEFDLSPRGVLGSGSRVELNDLNASGMPLDIEAECETLVDPMEPAWRGALKTPTLTGWVKALADEVNARAFSPLPAGRRAEFLQAIDSSLPSDYDELVSQTEGMELAPVSINGVQGIRSLVLPHGNYYVLASLQDDRGDLAVKQGERTARLYLLNSEGQEIDVLGSSFRDALEKLLRWPET